MAAAEHDYQKHLQRRAASGRLLAQKLKEKVYHGFISGDLYIYSAFLGPLVRPYQAFADFPSFLAFGPALLELLVLLLHHQLDSASSFASSPSSDSKF